MLEKFFAVTQASLYQVGALHPEKKLPYFLKIGLRKESSVPVGSLVWNSKLAVAKWLQFYMPLGSDLKESHKYLEDVDRTWWGGRTGFIVALFCDEEEARGCFSSADLALCDPRWLEQTKKVLEAIGDEHPTFSVCRSKNFALASSG